ncbi:MAG: cytochrome c peroxidase, partial [Pseudomonadota bacterium]|nr:cytochrome c peroxidase [Pseudomonadota bacterium]
GKNLFFDKILSGNLNISCATCHHVLTDTGDGLSLPVGEGGGGLGVSRDTGSGLDAIHERVPRNAQPIFNLGRNDFKFSFHDGRVEVCPSANSRFCSPAGDDLPSGLANVLAAQAMFPVTSPAEMAGQKGENAQADAADPSDPDLPRVWEVIAQKLSLVADYLPLFQAAFPDGPDAVNESDDITYVHAANAIAAFETAAWRFDDSPFDRYLRGEKLTMSPSAKRGMRVFYGKGGCAECHSGKFQTDQGFHAIAMPQIGPGKGDNLDGHDDFGREQVTGDIADRFKFRTPTLRNVALTPPYGHAGAYNTLESVVRHHLDPVNSLYDYEQSQAVLPSRPDLDAQDFVVMDDPDPARVAAIADANELAPLELSEKKIADLIEFLHALTDPAAIDLRNDMPASVPSGLPLAD